MASRLSLLFCLLYLINAIMNAIRQPTTSVKHNTPVKYNTYCLYSHILSINTPRLTGILEQVWYTNQTRPLWHGAYNLQSISACAKRVWPYETISSVLFDDGEAHCRVYDLYPWLSWIYKQTITWKWIGPLKNCDIDILTLILMQNKLKHTSHIAAHASCYKNGKLRKKLANCCDSPKFFPLQTFYYMVIFVAVINHYLVLKFLIILVLLYTCMYVLVYRQKITYVQGVYLIMLVCRCLFTIITWESSCIVAQYIHPVCLGRGMFENVHMCKCCFCMM